MLKYCIQSNVFIFLLSSVHVPVVFFFLFFFFFLGGMVKGECDLFLNRFQEKLYLIVFDKT